jgi:predicted dehydrogenase
MSQTTRIAILGAGWPGVAQARGFLAAGGFKLVAVADLIPERRRKMMAEFSIPREYADAAEALKDTNVEAVSICLPNHLHAATALAALRSGKHVICERPPSLNAAEAKRMAAAADKYKKVLLYDFQRRFGGHEMAAKVAIAKGFIGDPYHVRCVWTRTRGIPLGTGWYTQRAQSGGGAMLDVGLPLLDVGWHLLGQPKPLEAFAIAHTRLAPGLASGVPFDVDEAAFALLRFEGGKSIELAASWAMNQPQHQNGTVCRVHGTDGAIEVYTPRGAVLHRDFRLDGACKENPLKPPKLTHHAALMRHFRDCIAGRSQPAIGGPEGVALMEMAEAIYKSAASGKSRAV